MVVEKYRRVRGLLIRTLKYVSAGVITLVLVVLFYLGTAMLTARVPAQTADVERTGDAVKVRLLFGLLHTDIALPVTPELRQRFAFLNKTGVPMEHPQLQNIALGWGSRAFYTTAGTYWDIRLSTVLRAATGDSAVVRAVGMGDLSLAPDSVELTLSASQYERLLAGIEQILVRQEGRANHLEAHSIGPNDAFFEAHGHFNIFNPCNQWVNEVLRGAGVKLGMWTPTSQSLRASLAYFNGGSQP